MERRPADGEMAEQLCSFSITEVEGSLFGIRSCCNALVLFTNGAFVEKMSMSSHIIGRGRTPCSYGIFAEITY